MKFNRTTASALTTHGFILLEVILAIGLFAVVATAMVAALDRLSVATVSAKKEAACLRKLESVITEIQHSQSFRPGQFTFPADGTGVLIEAEVVPAQITNQDGQTLPGLFRVMATARFAEDEDFSRSQEVVVFRR